MRSLRHLIYVVTRLGTLPLYRLVERFLFRNVVYTEHQGISLCADDRGEAAQLFAKVVEALRLIEEEDPLRFRRLQHDLDRVLVTSFRIAVGAHFPRSRACYLSTNLLREYSSSNVAIVLVHEATHARVDAMGVLYSPDLIPRIERRCVQEEVAFARRLSQQRHPGIQKWIARREQRLVEMAGAAAIN